MSQYQGMTGYTKLFGSIVASTIWREDDKTRIVWITMLALSNKHGIVEASVPGLADLSRVTVDEARAAIVKLEAPDLDSRSKEEEGSRILKVDGGWMLVNHAKYRAKLNSEERREYLRNKQAEHRKRKQVSTTVNNRQQTSTRSTHTEAEAEEDPLVQTTNQRPSLQQVQTICDMRGYSKAEGERFWNHFESSGWIDKNGNAVARWEPKLAIWISDAKARPIEKAHHATNGQSSRGAVSASMQAMLDTKKLDRVEARIKALKDSVEGHDSMNEFDREELKDLKQQRSALKKTLGILV